MMMMVIMIINNNEEKLMMIIIIIDWHSFKAVKIIMSREFILTSPLSEVGDNDDNDDS